MKYEDVPRPLVEHHPHIKMLIESQEKRATDRTYYRERDKASAERMDIIKDSKNVELKDFWCPICRTDFKGVAVKQVEVDWSNSVQYIAFYRTKCWKGHWVQRLITDKFKDSYWSKSLRVAKDRHDAHNDLLQPFESGFQLLYGRKNT